MKNTFFRCTVCGNDDFIYSDLWKNMRCSQCKSAPRQRRIHYILNERIPNWRSLRIHEFAPMNTWISSECERYTSSQYFHGKPFGTMIRGIRNENIEKLRLEDEEIDLFLVEDVLEHIFRPYSAIKEMHRCLAKGGHMLISIPLEALPEVTRQCAKMEASEVTHLREPRYHGAPAGSSKSLVVWEYGIDVNDVFLKWNSGNSIEVYRGAMPHFHINNDSRATFLIPKLDAQPAQPTS